MVLREVSFGGGRETEEETERREREEKEGEEEGFVRSLRVAFFLAGEWGGEKRGEVAEREREEEAKGTVMGRGYWWGSDGEVSEVSSAIRASA